MSDTPPSPDAAPLPSPRAGGASRAETLRGEHPAWVNAALVRALTSVLMLALIAGAVRLREGTSLAQFDLVRLLLRTLALAFAVRAVLAVATWAAAFRADGGARKSALVLSDQALTLSLNGRDVTVRREDVVDVVTVYHGRAEARAPARGSVYLVRRGPLAPLVLPPWFAQTPELLTARLRRWLGPIPSGREIPGPSGDPEARYRALAHGKLVEADLAIPEGQAYMQRAPYAALLGIFFVADVYVHAGRLQSALMLPASAAAVLACTVFVGWHVWMARRRSTRLGIGLALTREELLARGGAGVVAVPWAQLSEIGIDARNAWSPLLGALDVRTLHLQTHDGQTLLFDGGFLGYPVEVVAALCEAYRRGAMEPAR
jgi:hypothetical protein